MTAEEVMTSLDDDDVDDDDDVESIKSWDWTLEGTSGIERGVDSKARNGSE